MLTSWPPSSQRSSTDHWNCAKSLHASNAPPSHPNTQNYRTKWLQACVSKVCGHEVIWKTGAGHLKDITGPSLDPLQFAYRSNRSVDDAVNMGLHYVLNLDRPGTYVRNLFVYFSSAFNTIIPNLLLPKLTQFSVPTSIRQWINSFMTDRQQLVRLDKYTSSTRTISTGAPQGCVLSPLLFSLYMNDCTSKDPLSSSWSLQMTPHWSASSRTWRVCLQTGVKELSVWCI